MRVVILGGGESGCGSAILAKTRGCDVFLSDSGNIGPEYTAMLERHGIGYEQGKHTGEQIYSADLVIKSPGIPGGAAIIQELRRRGVEIVSEIEFAGRYTKGKCICVTGSNGKTTTTTLIYKILKNAGYDVAVGGNIGKSFAYSVATGDKEWYVLEISSFQLDDTYTFKPYTSVLLNITPDHLDRYDYDFGKYASSKMSVIRNQAEGDYFVYWADDKVISVELGKLTEPKVRLLPFSSRKQEREGSFFDSRDGMITARMPGREVRIDSGRMRIKGLHNMYNTMASVLAAMSAGVDESVILETVYCFGGVEHRMEFVAEIEGVEYVNDSKATNVDSTWYALDSMRRPTVWIAGGTDKGNDYAPLMELARRKVKALVCLGLDNEKLKGSFKGAVAKIYDTHSLGEAMEAVAEAANAGDTVLLSPACASFDLFINYEDRGRQFKQQIEKLRK